MGGIKKIFRNYALSIFTVVSALLIFLQVGQLKKIDIIFTLSLSGMLALLGGGVGAFFVSGIRKREKEIETYQIAGEPETKGLLRFVFRGEKLQFFSKLPPNIAIERLKQNVSKSTFVHLFSWPEMPLVGKVTIKRVWLIYVTIGERNSFNPVFTGRFKRNGAGSILEGRYRISLPIIVLLCIWFGGLIIGSIMAEMIMLLQFKGQIFTTPIWIGVLAFIIFPSLMFAGGLGLVAYGKRIARASQRHMTDIIEHSIGQQI